MIAAEFVIGLSQLGGRYVGASSMLAVMTLGVFLVAVVSVLAGFAAGARCWLTATAGNIDDTTIAGCQILGMWSSSAIGTPVANKAYCTLNRPVVQSQIT